MGLSSQVSCEAGSFSHHRNPHRFLQPEVLRLYFSILEPWVAQSISLPSCSSQLIHTQMWDYLVCQPPPRPHDLPPCLTSSPSQLPAPPTSLDECFIFNSLVVRLPCSFIFWQFWLFFLFKLSVILLLVVQGSEAFLPMPPSWLSTPHPNFLK